MLLLGIETATHTCSVALRDDERLLAELSLHLARLHAERLPPLIQQALGHTGRQPAELDAVAVSKGPGSYTGLRIGVSTAKGLVEATGAALVGAPSLEALAARMAPWTEAGDLLVTVFGSRRGEVYAAAYAASQEGAPKTLREATALPLKGARRWLPEAPTGRIWLGGPGASELAEHLDATAARVLGANTVTPSGAGVAEVGLRRFQDGQTEDPASFEPFYLKDFVPG